MSANVRFLSHRWTKLHRYVVQECMPLSVADIVNARRLPAHYRKDLPEVKLVRERTGCTRRTYITCPVCERLCEHLYLPPNIQNEWACRQCHNLVYGSQRYGRKHLLRRILPTAQKTEPRIAERC